MKTITKKDIINHITRYLNSNNILIASQGNEDVHLFSSKFGLCARDLVCIVHNLQQTFSVTFNENDVLSDDFFTLNHLAILTEGKILRSQG